MAIFSAPELFRRWNEVLARLDGEECYIALSFHNSYYLSGLPMQQWGRFSITVLFPGNEPVLITPDFEELAALDNSPIADVRYYRDEQGPSHPVALTMLAEVLAEKGVQVAAIEGEALPWSAYEVLVKAAPGVRFIDRTDIVDEVRLVSSPEELKYIREASRLVDVCMQAILDAAQPGMTEIELAGIGRQAMERAASLDYSLNTSCYLQQGERSANCHARPFDTPLEEGNIIEVICEAEVEYYQASLERPIIIGIGSPEVERATEVAAESFAAAVAEVKPGNTFGAVDKAGRAVLQAAGYNRIPTGAGLVRGVLHHTGGRTERGELRMHNDRVLQPNMVVTVEPWAIIPGVGGPRHTDVIRVTEDGNEFITTTPGGVLRTRDFGIISAS